MRGRIPDYVAEGRLRNERVGRMGGVRGRIVRCWGREAEGFAGLSLSDPSARNCSARGGLESMLKTFCCPGIKLEPCACSKEDDWSPVVTVDVRRR